MTETPKRGNRNEIPLWILEVSIVDGTRSLFIYSGGSEPEKVKEFFDHVVKVAQEVRQKY